LDANQRLLIEEQPEIFDQEELLLNAICENYNIITTYGKSLESDLYHLISREEKQNAELARIQAVYLRNTVIPRFFELYPQLSYGPKDLTAKRAFMVHIRESLLKCFNHLQFTSDAIFATKRVFYEEFTDFVRARFRHQKAAMGQYSRLLTTYSRESGWYMRNLSNANQKKITRAAISFAQVNCDAPMLVILQLIFKAMLEVQRIDDQAAALAMAMSGNLQVFELLLFLNALLLQEAEFLETLVNSNEIPLLKRFERLVLLIQRTRVL
jgi:hypothetical protein